MIDGPHVYKVIIDSPHGQGRYQKEYIGPATSEDDAVKQARTVFAEQPGDRLVAVEDFDLGDRTDDVSQGPSGADV